MATQKKANNASYAEVVFQGKPKVVRSFLHGLMLGAGLDGQVFFSWDEGIDHGGKAPRFAEKFGLPGTDVHVIVDSGVAALLKKHAKRIGPEHGLCITTQRRIRSAKMDVEFVAYAPKYDREIMDFLENLPAGVKLRGFKHEIRHDEAAKGVEAYSAVHHFEAHGQGTITGPVEVLVDYKRRSKAHPLITVGEIRISHA
jgi:hypothetical protein